MANWKKNLIENFSFNGLLLYKLVTYIYLITTIRRPSRKLHIYYLTSKRNIFPFVEILCEFVVADVFVLLKWRYYRRKNSTQIERQTFLRWSGKGGHFVKFPARDSVRRESIVLDDFFTAAGQVSRDQSGETWKQFVIRSRDQNCRHYANKVIRWPG